VDNAVVDLIVRLWLSYGEGVVVVSSTVKLRISRRVLKRLLCAVGTRPSTGLDEVLEKYSENVEKDVLEEFLSERR